MNFRECYTMCLDDPQCYAAYAEEDSFRRGGQKCQLFKKEAVKRLGKFKKEFDNAKVWVRNACPE